MLAPWIVVTGLDGSGKTTLVNRLAQQLPARPFRLPMHDFVGPLLAQAGEGLPFGDVQTDRLLFALDARLANSVIRRWRHSSQNLVSQRGFMDNFIFGAVQGRSYQQSEGMLRSRDLERPSAQIYLVADPAIACARLAQCATHDKYETAEFIAVQYQETLRFFEAVTNRAPPLRAFFDIPSVLIDTSEKTFGEVYVEAAAFLRRAENSALISLGAKELRR